MMMMASATTVCEVCQKQPFKYKCPQCQAKYCSVGCYKIHKETVHTIVQHIPSEQQQQSTVSSTASFVESTSLLPPTESIHAASITASSEGTVPFEKLKRIEGSSKLLNALKDERLQNLIREIDQSASSYSNNNNNNYQQRQGNDPRLTQLNLALANNPEFTEFVQQMMEVVLGQEGQVG